MVVVTAPRLRKGYVGATTAPSKSPSRDNHQRINHRSVYDTPEGFYKCPIPTCSGLVRQEIDQGKIVACDGPERHELDYDTECRSFMPTKAGGFTHAGLTMAQQGELAEEIVASLGGLGPYGRLTLFEQYHCPLDGYTDTNLGAEIKSCSNRCRNQAFNPGHAATKQRKDRFARERGYRGILGILVVINFETSTADIYIVEMRKIHCFYPTRAPYAVGVPFKNPCLSAAKEPEPIPF